MNGSQSFLPFSSTCCIPSNIQLSKSLRKYIGKYIILGYKLLAQDCLISVRCSYSTLLLMHPKLKINSLTLI